MYPIFSITTELHTLVSVFTRSYISLKQMVLFLVLVLRWTAPVNHGEFGLLGHVERNRFHMEITIMNCPMTPYSPKSRWLAINLFYNLYTK